MRMRSAWTLGTDLPKKGIVVICNLDAQSENVAYVKDLIRRRGHAPILLDFSMQLAPPFAGDVTCEQVAARGGMPVEKVRSYYHSDRAVATENQIAGGAAIVHDLLRQGRVHGVIGIGCSFASQVATGIMKTLPFGLPKLMASPAASDAAAIESYVRTRDITMHHTVLDIGKTNPLLKAQITNAVGAICGMVEMTRGTEYVLDKPVVAVSSCAICDVAVRAALGMLEAEGFIPVACDAQGKGEKAMEELIRDGAFAGVLDFCPGLGRLMATISRGIPTVLMPCGLDILGSVSRARKLGRAVRSVGPGQDLLGPQVRNTVEELGMAADTIAARLRQAKGPFTFLVPLRGWSALDREGRPLFDPAADAAFARRLKEQLEDRSAIVEVDLNLDTPEFARVAVNEFGRLFAAADGQRMLRRRGAFS
jgi:uncharacterized protein (UPF0261 family)